MEYRRPFFGEVLNSRPRDSYVLATQALLPMGGGDRGLSRAQYLSDPAVNAKLAAVAATTGSERAATFCQARR